MAPFAPVNQTPMILSSRPGFQSAGLKRISENSGDFVTWSADSLFIRYSLASTLYEVKISGISPFKALYSFRRNDLCRFGLHLK